MNAVLPRSGPVATVVAVVVAVVSGSCHRPAPAPEPDASAVVHPRRSLGARVAAPGEVPVDVLKSRISLSIIKDRDTVTPVIATLALHDGAVSLEGTPSARLSIELDSFDSGIPLRNERVRGIVFETSAVGWETAELTVPTIPADVAKALRDKRGVEHAALDGTLRIHGHSVPVALLVDAGTTDSGRLWVKTASPVQVRASEFDLTGNIRRLSSICMHDSIDDVVSATVALEFGAQ